MKELLSPGVEVFVDDQSQYIQGSTNSVPYVLLATASNKASGAGVGIAPGTLPQNANNVYLVTSQRELLATYGKPLFYTTSTGSPINGDELNEYGLLAAYSALGISNRCYIQRVDINLEELKASVNRPMGHPDNGEYWLDTKNTLWGIQQWNQVTGLFTTQEVNVILDTAYLDIGTFIPTSSYGDIGDYSVVALSRQNPIYFKHGAPNSLQTTSTMLSELYNTWVQVGSDDWKTAWPTVTSVLAPGLLPIGGTVTINGVVFNITVLGTTVSDFAAQINTAFEALVPAGDRAGVYAGVINGKLILYGDSHAINGSTDGAITLEHNGGGLLETLGITAGTYNVPALQISPSYQNPRWNTNIPPTPPNPNASPTGSVWLKTNNVNLGANFVVKKYDSVLASFVQQACKVYEDDSKAIYGLDPVGGGLGIPTGTLYSEYDPNNNNTAGFTVYRRYSTGPTAVPGIAPPVATFTVGDQFIMQATEPGTTNYTEVTVTLSGTTPQDFIADVSGAALSNVSANIDGAGNIVFVHATGGDINLLPVGLPTTWATSPIVTAQFANSGFTQFPNRGKALIVGGETIGVTLSNWVGYPSFAYVASNTAPDQDPIDGTPWYYSVFDQEDIMIQNNGAWYGYKNVTNDIRGYNLSATNYDGIIYSVTPPKYQTDTGKTPLVAGDLWIDISDLINYPKLSRWQIVNGEGQWVLINNADHTTENGILFADARWSSTGAVDPVVAELPSIQGLQFSNYIDLDAPNPLLYPQGTLLFNTRRSGFNVKTFQVNYFNTTEYSIPMWNDFTNYVQGQKVVYNGLIYVNINFNPALSSAGIPPTNNSQSATFWAPLATNTWVTASSNNEDGSPNMGRNAQRQVIVKALQTGVDNSAQARQEQLNFNLLACTQYPELCPNLVELNNDRGDTGFVIGDTPLRLGPTDLQAWIAGTASPYLDKNITVQLGDQYTGIFYPSCQTKDLTGNSVVTAPSHMMIRTIIRSDQLSWPWFAPAGVRRGLVENAIRIGYLNNRNEFVSFSNDQATRDLLYVNHINPITFQPGVGILNFGNKTCTTITSALDRINVARLIGYIRVQLYKISQQFLFEPNDQLTRDQFRNAVTSLMLDIQTKRGIYDYLVICDLSNNTPTTIDRNELWLDLAIEPVKAVEFIYIPVRILNTGELAGLTVGA